MLEAGIITYNPETKQNEFHNIAQEAQAVNENWVLNQIQKGIESAVTSVINFVKDLQTNIKTGDVTGVLLKCMTVAIAGLVVFVVLDLLGTKILASGFDFEGAKKYLKDVIKSDLLVSAVIGSWVGAGLKSPMEQLSNVTFRPTIPTVSSATKMHLQGKINDSQWRDILARWGIPEGYMQFMKDDYDNKPDLGNVSRIIQFIDFQDSAMDWVLTENGVSMTQVREMWKKYWKGLQLRDEYAQFNGVLKNIYVSGLCSETVLEDYLQDFKGSQTEIDKIVENLNHQKEYELIKTEIATRTWYYRNDCYISETPENDFYDDLLTLGLDSAITNATVRLEASKKGIVWEYED